MTYYLSSRLGKLLFPHLPRDQRQSRLSTIVATVIVSVIVAGTVAALMFHVDR